MLLPFLFSKKTVPDRTVFLGIRSADGNEPAHMKIFKPPMPNRTRGVSLNGRASPFFLSVFVKF